MAIEVKRPFDVYVVKQSVLTKLDRFKFIICQGSKI